MKYASVGANGLGMPFVFDGLNEKGLAIGLFYFPTTAGYMPYSAGDAGKTIAPWEMGSWILDNFATVEEVKANVSKIVVAEVVFKDWGFVPPVHFVVHDASGKSIVIEYVGGKLNVHENPLGVMTNSPTFDWHMTNLRNYVNFSLTNVPPVQLGPVKLVPFGQGSGMLGLPGDFTPPSRFVARSRSVNRYCRQRPESTRFYRHSTSSTTSTCPRAPSANKKDDHGNILADYTVWTSANDLKAKKFYFRTYQNSQIRTADLTKMNLDAKDITKVSMQGDEVIKSLTP